jgi:hypothetical protein
VKSNKLFLLVICLSALGSVFVFHHASGAQVARTPADDTKAELIGEGVVSTSDDEFGGSLSPDGTTLYYEITVPPHYLYVMCESHRVDGKWQKPQVLPFSGLYRDSDPVLTPDGNTLLFASDRPRNGVESHDFYIWAAKKTANGWGEPRALEGPVNREGSQVFASMARNGNLYFTSDRNQGRFDIYRSRLVDAKYQPAEDLGPNVNGEGIFSLEALIAPDESYLLIGSFGPAQLRQFRSVHQLQPEWLMVQASQSWAGDQYRRPRVQSKNQSGWQMANLYQRTKHANRKAGPSLYQRRIQCESARRIQWTGKFVPDPHGIRLTQRRPIKARSKPPSYN